MKAINQLMREARLTPHGPIQVALLEEAVRLADKLFNVQEGFNTRLELITATAMGGRPDLLLTAFSWCLAQYDQDPQMAPLHDLLWKYKYVVRLLPQFPTISRQQIEDLLADMSRRFQAAGSTMHAVHLIRATVRVEMGDLEAAAKEYETMHRTRRDSLSHCAACILDCQIESLVLRGEDEQALILAAPILAGQLRCTTVPQRTYAKILLPLLRLGRAREAMSYHRTGYPMIGSNPYFVRHAGMHLTFLVLTMNLDRAIKLLEQHLAVALSAPSLIDQFHFLLATRLLLNRLAEKQMTLKLRLPETLPPPDAQGRHQIADLIEWLDNYLCGMAICFDERNGNPFFTKMVGGIDDLMKCTTPLQI